MKTSIIKALTYRLFGTLVTAALTLYFTHRWQFVGLIGGADFVVKVAAYFVHEEFWRHRRLLKISVPVRRAATKAL